MNTINYPIDIESLAGSKILVVDDIKENLELLVKFLELDGYDVSFAMGGNKAVKLAQLSPPDLILLDVMMPGIDGFEVCRLLKSNQETRHIPIIFVTGKNTEEDILEGFNNGAVDYITKPIKQKEVHVRVKNHLQLSKLLRGRKNLIEELQQHNEEKDKFLAIKTEQLIEAEKHAGLGELVAQLCHEISTPIGTSITAITSSAEKVSSAKIDLDEGKFTKKTLDDLLKFEHESQMIIESNLTYAANLVSSFQHVGIDQFTEEVNEIELVSYFNHILRILKPRLKKTKHSVAIHNNGAIMMKTLPSAFSQIVINLVNNSLNHAFKETPSGAIDITLTAQSNTLTLLYQDNGAGISEEHLSHIFDKYFTTAKNSGGSGVGLYIIKQIVEQKLNGEISCQSSIGNGVSFTIKLPITL